MKKLLGIVVLGLLLSNSTQASESKKVSIEIFTKTISPKHSLSLHFNIRKTSQVTKGTNDLYNLLISTFEDAARNCNYNRKGLYIIDECLNTVIYYSEIGNSSNNQKYVNTDGIDIDKIKIGWDGIENAVEGTSPTHRQYAEEIEDTLAERARQEDLEMTFSYESRTGEKITKDNKWNKFWQGVGWILSEHGEEILNAAIDLKYGTSKSTGGSGNCTATRSGNVIHEHCPNMYCSYVKVGNVIHRNCRQK